MLNTKCDAGHGNEHDVNRSGVRTALRPLLLAWSHPTPDPAMARFLLAPLLRWLSRLSFPRLFVISAGLFVLDLLIPDLVPFADEILLGLGTLLFANWKGRPKKRS